MKPSYPATLQKLDKGQPVSVNRVGGGCISDAQIVTFSDGTSAFVKCRQGIPGMFECEASGLRTLAESGAIRVPEVLAVGDDSLVLECITGAPKSSDFYEAFGRAFAGLHQCRGPVSGFSEDNFIGSTPQPNNPLLGGWDEVTVSHKTPGDGSDWLEFFLERRLRFQVEMAAERGHGNELVRLLDRAEVRIVELLGEAVESPSLLHGDLWSGNFIVDEKGEACLIDPAVYYGHREADLAMTRLFGGFNRNFYDSYEEALPLAPGHQERLPLYQLYHLLNHFNLFGSAYHSQCLQILRRYSSRSV